MTVLVFSFIPSVSEAGFFNWLSDSNSGLASSAKFPIFQSSFIYAQTNFGDLNDTESELLSAALRDNVVVQPTSLLTIQEKTTLVATNKTNTANQRNVSNKKVMTVRASAYSSTPDQTDASPFITAKGTRVRDGIIAANFLPFNTLVKIPELYGDKVFVVEDRMNPRYTNTIDIWFPDRQSAIQFGRKTVKIEIAGKL